MGRKTSKNRYAIIVTILVICLIIVIGFTSKQRENISILEKWIGSILNPVQKVISAGALNVGERVSSVANFRRVLSENAGLKQQLNQLEDELVQMRLTRDELEELRGLKFVMNNVDGLDEYQPIAANVVAKSPSNWFDIFTIDAGEEQGLSKDAIVLSSDGLVGRIYETAGSWSKVISIIDNNSSVSFQVLRNRDYQGVISGNITNELTGYLFDSMAEVVTGDKLITSGMGIYPKGILIGEVIEVAKSEDQLLKTVVVEPAVNFKKMNKVLVISPNRNWE